LIFKRARTLFSEQGSLPFLPVKPPCSFKDLKKF
jgi:hypothetical protein